MRERIHDTLDGKLERDALSAAERAELAAFEHAIARTLESSPDETIPDLSAGVWRSIDAAEARRAERRARFLSPWSTLADAASWLWSPRAIRLRPAYALAALLLAVAVPVALQQAERSAGDAAGTTSPERMLVQFRVNASGAHDVALVGDFSGWDQRHHLQQVANGVWSLTIPLEPGVYNYAFVVDGEKWVLDPLAPQVADGFGGSNSRVAVLPPERGSAL